MDKPLLGPDGTPCRRHDNNSGDPLRRTARPPGDKLRATDLDPPLPATHDEQDAEELRQWWDDTRAERLKERAEWAREIIDALNGR